MTTTQLMTTRLIGLVAVLFFLWLAAALMLDPAAPFGFRATAAVMGVGFLALLVRWHRRKDAEGNDAIKRERNIIETQSELIEQSTGKKSTRRK